ncbi:hypothetical protein ACFPRL_25775 [Pseudoclavibacter helvolus]
MWSSTPPASKPRPSLSTSAVRHSSTSQRPGPTSQPSGTPRTRPEHPCFSVRGWHPASVPHSSAIWMRVRATRSTSRSCSAPARSTGRRPSPGHGRSPDPRSPPVRKPAWSRTSGSVGRFEAAMASAAPTCGPISQTTRCSEVATASEATWH